MRQAAQRIAELAQQRKRADGAVVVVGVAGAVASGKSTLAAEVARAATTGGVPTEVVSTDGFLLPHAVLSERGLLMHKGFPESYDVDALRSFVEEVHSGADEVMVPQYSHEIYDVVAAVPIEVGDDAVIVVEGVNALCALADVLDLAVYLHAEETDLERWYVERFHRLCDEARDDEQSFYRQFAAMSADEVDALARSTWRSINLVNLRENIAPSRALADCVVVKGPDHAVVAIEVRDDDHRR
jgi:type I pantothenate kinase